MQRRDDFLNEQLRAIPPEVHVWRVRLHVQAFLVGDHAHVVE